MWQQRLSFMATRGLGGGLAHSFGSYHSLEVALVVVWGLGSPGRVPLPRCRSAAWTQGGGYKTRTLGHERRHKLKLYFSPGWTECSNLLPWSFWVCFQKAPNWVYWIICTIGNFFGGQGKYCQIFYFFFFLKTPRYLMLCTVGGRGREGKAAFFFFLLLRSLNYLRYELLII